MRLTMDVPGVHDVTIFINGVKQTGCIAADDMLNVALCFMRDANGKDIPAPLHRDWKPGEFDHEGVVVCWRTGTVTFAFDPPEKGTLAESCWRLFINHSALWALGELVALEANSATPEYFEECH